MGVLKIYSGCDFHITYDNVMDACRNPHKYTINHKNYLRTYHYYKPKNESPPTGKIPAAAQLGGV